MSTALDGLKLIRNDIEYEVRIATAQKTHLGDDDHGWLPRVETDVVTLFGLQFGDSLATLGPFLREFCETIGVGSWEQVRGTSFAVLFHDHIARGVAGLNPQSGIMIWDEFFSTRRGL